ncbi:MAG: DUF418 domain-containing protein [Flavobacteriales bacterium]|nr:DUF418 domain-containing protein [Flavobacteriales bacterium]
MKSKRIIGFDLARGLAIVGMIMVNFKVVMSEPSGNIYYRIMDALSGKAAALFVILAGLGMTLMFQSAKRKKSKDAIRKVKIDLLKRAAFLFVIGLSYYFIWPADILHYYGIYLSIGVLLLSVNRKWLLLISGILIFIYPVLLMVFDYEAGWIIERFEYTDFFTLNGFFRNLFFNGFHPVIPWLAFLATGIWVGRIDFSNRSVLKKTAIISIAIFIATKFISMALLSIGPEMLEMTHDDMMAMFSTEPMPPNPFYMISASSLAIFVICASVYLSDIFSNTLMVNSLVSYGRLALSNYFFHVIIGMGVLAIAFNDFETPLSSRFIFWYALAYNLVFIVFSHLWLKKFKRGPIEILMRKITG